MKNRRDKIFRFIWYSVIITFAISLISIIMVYIWGRKGIGVKPLYSGALHNFFICTFIIFSPLCFIMSLTTRVINNKYNFLEKKDDIINKMIMFYGFATTLYMIILFVLFHNFYG